MLPSLALNNNFFYYIIYYFEAQSYGLQFEFCKLIFYPNLEISIQDNITRINCVSVLIHCNSMHVEREFFKTYLFDF